jgi:hypothetical protein
VLAPGHLRAAVHPARLVQKSGVWAYHRRAGQVPRGGALHVGFIWTHSWGKAPSFKPITYNLSNEKNRFQSLPFKCNLHRYTEDKQLAKTLVQERFFYRVVMHEGKMCFFK